VLVIEGLEEVEIYNLILSFESTASGLKDTKPVL